MQFRSASKRSNFDRPGIEIQVIVVWRQRFGKGEGDFYAMIHKTFDQIVGTDWVAWYDSIRLEESGVGN